MAVMRAKVSVILPSLNVAAYIRECLDSVIGQSLRELEIICVDGGSVDGTAEILQEYAERDERIVLLHSEKKSYGRQVNLGLDYASGDYVAVLETDDWIVPDMYQCLYRYAEEDRLDYAAADFDVFREMDSGYRCFATRRLFPAARRDWYGKILDSGQIATLRAADYVLWRGIYRRQFLEKHQIRLHESAGAAFQDMGFLQQVKTFAQRAVYIDQSFYRYRQDREAASSVSPEGLRYYEEEFRWLNEKKTFFSQLQGVHQNYYYFTMSISFLTKYEQILEALDGNWQDERLSGSYQWFREQIGDALDRGLIGEEMYDKALWEGLTFLLKDREGHAGQLMDRKRKREKTAQAFLKVTKKRPLILFGCGRRGEKLLLFCDRHQIPVLAFCDNRESLHGKEKYLFPILAPEVLREELYGRDGAVVLTMKEGKEQVREQLIRLGIEADRIISEIPDGIL